MTYCNSISPTRTHSCELYLGHPRKCRRESFDGGYAFWDRTDQP